MTEMLLQNVKDALESTFIGESIFSQNEIDEMKDYCRKSLLRRSSSYSKKIEMEEVEVLIVLIVNLSKNWGSIAGENRFWVKLLNDIYDDSSIKPTMFYDDFERLLNKYNKTVFISPKGKRMIKEVLLYHAFAPKVSNRSLINLLWNWYIDEDILDEGNNPMFSYVAKYLALKFSGDIENLESDVVLEGKTYMLRAALKYGFIQDEKMSIVLVEKIIGYFNQIWHENRDVNDSHFAVECTRAVNEILLCTNLKRADRNKIKKEQVVSDLNKLKTMLLYEFTENEQLNVFMPELRGIEDNYENARIEIFAGDKIVHNEEYYILGREMKKRLKRITIPFNTLIRNFDNQFDLRVKLYFDDVLKFDSQERLYRDFLLFRNSREIRGDCRPDVYYLVHPLCTTLSKITNCDCSGIGSNHVVSLAAQEGQCVTSKRKTIFFNSSKQNSHMVFNPKPINRMKYSIVGNDFDVFSKIDNCSIFLSSSYDRNKIVVIHNDESFEKLTDISVIDDVNGCCQIEVSAQNWGKEGCHKLLLKDLSDGKVIGAYSYIVIKSLSFTINGEYVFGNKEINISFCVKGNQIYCGSVGGKDEEISFEYLQGLITINLPTIKLRIDELNWQKYFECARLWKSNELLNNNSLIEIENNSICSVLLVDSKKNELAKNNQGKYLIGDMLLRNAYKSKNEIYISIDGQTDLLFVVYNQEVIDELNDSWLVYEDAQLKVNFESMFVGGTESMFKLELFGLEKYVFDIKTKGNIFCKIEDGEYDAVISIIKDGIYDSETIKLITETVVLGNPDKICFHNKKIDLLTTKKEKGRLKFDKCFLSNLEYIKEENGKSIYSAILSMPKTKGRNVEVEKLDDKVLRVYFVSDKEIVAANIDDKLKQPTSKEIDYINILPCRSCYYKVEE